MRGTQYVHGLQLAAGAGNRRWPVNSSSDCGENEIKAQNGLRTGNKQSWGGEESPVSVIGHNCMMQQLGSHPSSGSTSMEHPIFCTSPPPTTAQLYHRLSHHPDHHSLSTAELSTSQFLPDSAASYAGLLSERVQQAFRKSHELQQPHVVKTWPTTSATTKRMDWLNLQEDPPLINAGNKLMSTVSQYSRLSRPLQAVAGSTDHVSQQQYDRASSEEERLSVYSSTRGSDRQEDEDGVIDFFPSAARPSSVNYMHRSESRSRGSNGRWIKVEENRRGSLKRRSSCIRSAGRGHPNIIQYTGPPIVDIVDALAENVEGRASTSSYKWDDAERWLTSPTTSASAPLVHQQPPPSFSNVDLHGLAKAAPWVRVQARIKPQLMSEPTSTQDKHVPVSGDSHASLREAGTELRKRDIATQSTPAEASRRDSPEEERAILSTTPKKKPTHQLGPGQEVASTALPKTSPPRHNTPARRSVSCTRERGNRIKPLRCEPLHFTSGKLNMLELESCHLDKLKLARDLPLGTSSSWLLFAEDESQQTESKLLLERKSPPHQSKVNMLEARVSAWEDVERAKHIAKFKKEEAKIEAWESLQRAGADAELRKLEVKLEKMRFEGREKIMGRLGAAQRRAQEMRGVAEAQKAEQLTRVVMRANHIRKSGHVPSSTFNVMCSLTTKIKPTSNLSFS